MQKGGKAVRHRAVELKISRKMIAVFLAVCFVSISISTICVSYAAMKNINRRTEVLAQAVNAQAATGLEQFIQSCRGLMMAVLVDSDVLNALSRGNIPVSEQAEYKAQVNKLLFRLIKMQPLLTHAGIVLRDGQTFQTGVSGENADLSALMGSAWMRQIMEGERTFTLVPMHDGAYTNRFGRGPVISAVQKLYGPSRQYAGMILLDVESDSYSVRSPYDALGVGMDISAELSALDQMLKREGLKDPRLKLTLGETAND